MSAVSVAQENERFDIQDINIISESFDKEHDFMYYVARWNKSYSKQSEFRERFERWSVVDAYIEEVNAPNSGYTHTAGHNEFSDWT